MSGQRKRKAEIDDTVRVILSPERQITDPDEAESLGLTVDAKRLREMRDIIKPTQEI